MFNSLKPILCASLVMLFTMSAFAKSSPSAIPQTTPAVPAAIDTKNLVNVMREEIRKCPALNCPGLRVQLAAMTSADFASMPKENRSSIREKMIELARDLWPDTILEGPFHVKFNIRLEREEVQMLIVDGAWVGYRIGYSDKAWDMDRCSPITTPESKQDLNQCESGRIFDRGFITSDLSFAFRDESTISHFEEVE